MKCESNGLFHSPDQPCSCIATDSPISIQAQEGNPSLEKLQKLANTCQNYPICFVSRVNLDNILVIHCLIESIVKLSLLLLRFIVIYENLIILSQL